MSQRHPNPLPIIEWSPGRVSCYDPATETQILGDTISDVAHAVTGRVVLLTFSRRNTFVRTLRLPDAPREDLAKVLAVQIGQLFPISSSEVAYDFKITPDVNHEGRLVVVAAVRSELLRQTLSQLKDRGLVARLAAPEAFGSVLLAEQHGSNTALILEPTEEGLALDVVADGELRYSRLAPSPRSSEELQEEISRTFAIAAVPDGPIIAAGGLNYPLASVQTNTRTNEAFSKGSWSTIGINFELPEARLLRERARQAKRVRTAALLGVAAAIVWGFAIWDHAEANERAERASALWNQRITKARGTLNTAKTKVTTQQNISQTLDRAFQPKQQMSDVLLVVANAAPPNIWLTGVTVDRGKPLQIRGSALSNEAISLFTQNLSSDARFRDVDILGANRTLIDTTSVFQFSVRAHVVGNLPVVEEAPRRRS